MLFQVVSQFQDTPHFSLASTFLFVDGILKTIPNPVKTNSRWMDDEAMIGQLVELMDATNYLVAHVNKTVFTQWHKFSSFPCPVSFVFLSSIWHHSSLPPREGFPGVTVASSCIRSRHWRCLKIAIPFRLDLRRNSRLLCVPTWYPGLLCFKDSPPACHIDIMDNSA